MNGTFGTDFGLSSLPGFADTADWLLQMTGPTGRLFGFADGRDAARREPTLFWFASRIETGVDGRTVTLIKQGKRVRVCLEMVSGGTDAAWTSRQVTPLLNEWDSPLPGAWQLYFDVVAPADGKLA